MSMFPQESPLAFRRFDNDNISCVEGQGENERDSYFLVLLAIANRTASKENPYWVLQSGKMAHHGCIKFRLCIVRPHALDEDDAIGEASRQVVIACNIWQHGVYQPMLDVDAA